MNLFNRRPAAPLIYNVSGSYIGRTQNWQFDSYVNLIPDSENETLTIDINTSQLSASFTPELNSISGAPFLTYTNISSSLVNSYWLGLGYGMKFASDPQHIFLTVDDSLIAQKSTFEAVHSNHIEEMITAITSTLATSGSVLSQQILSQSIALINPNIHQNRLLQMIFGDGSDGDLTVEGGYTLSRDMYFNNLIVKNSGQILTNGWKVYVRGVLDMSLARDGAFSNNATRLYPGASGSLGGGTRGGFGAPGVSNNNGIAGGLGTDMIGFACGGNGGNSYTSGNSLYYVGFAGSTGGTISATQTTYIRKYIDPLIRCEDILRGGCGGAGGPSAGNVGGITKQSKDGGEGGHGAGVVAIYAYQLIPSTISSSLGHIQANGFEGETVIQDNPGELYNLSGGSSAGAGGGAGFIYLCVGKNITPTNQLSLVTRGGRGGDGSTHILGVSDGRGAQGGQGGQCVYINMTSPQLCQFTGPAATASVPSGLIGTDGTVSSITI